MPDQGQRPARGLNSVNELHHQPSRIGPSVDLRPVRHGRLVQIDTGKVLSGERVSHAGYEDVVVATQTELRRAAGVIVAVSVAAGLARRPSWRSSAARPSNCGTRR